MKSNVPEEHKKNIIVKLACGSIAGLLGQTLTYPLDVVRRQMQVPCACYMLNVVGSMLSETKENTLSRYKHFRDPPTGREKEHLEP